MRCKQMSLATTAVISYCVLALGVTWVSTVQAQESSGKVESKAAAKKLAESPVEPSSNEIAGDKSDSQAQPNGVQQDSTTKDKSSVGDPKTKVSGGQEKPTSEAVSVTSDVESKIETTNLRTSAFSVEVPEWYLDEAITKENGELLMPVHAFGLTDELLKQDIESRVFDVVNDYLDQNLGDGAHQYIGYSLRDLKVQGVFQQEEVRKGTYELNGQDEPMDFYYATLRFDEQFRAEAERTWMEKRQSSRLLQIGLLSAGGLLVLATLFGGIRLNSATSGFYQGRLQFLTILLILGIIIAASYFGTRFEWI